MAIFSKKKPDEIVYGNGYAISDAEGRVVRVDIGDLTIVNAYFPSGTSGEERQQYKYQWLNEFFEYIEKRRRQDPDIWILEADIADGERFVASLPR